jgi:Kef-type K+ transport system membrane component KefB/mannitol/fructose-specific phosphotransferase system IIA component (Ntr-type)
VKSARVGVIPLFVICLLGIWILLAAVPIGAAEGASGADGVTAHVSEGVAPEEHSVEAGHGLEHRMTMLALQIGVILFAGYFGSRVAIRLRIPPILGELAAGILIGPYALGVIALPGYPGGLFPRIANVLSISPELYGFAVVASIVLLFLMGLETDIRLFLRFAVKGSVVGLSAAVLSVIAGVTVGRMMLGEGWGNPGSLFLGVVAIATSIDITGRILSERHKMAAPEGVTILAASVIEDVMGITLLAIVLGVDALQGAGENGRLWREVATIGGRALAVWLGFTALGIIFARRISGLLKAVRNPAQIAVLSLGLALILAGIFEAAGLAMIIGAYVMGLSLANTDISFVVQEKIETVHQFFDPIFFTVIGMLINLTVVASGEVLFFGLLFGVLAVAAKLIGCAVPSLALGFTWAGAARIAVGMVPRGEVALVIASIGIGSGVLDDRLFGVTILMTLFSTAVGPPVFNRLLQTRARTTRFTVVDDEMVTSDFEFGSEDLTRFLLSDVLATMRNEGFYVNAAEGERKIYHMRKDAVFIAMMATPVSLHFTSRRDDVTLVNNLVYESILSMQQQVSHIRAVAKPVELRRQLVETAGRSVVDWYRHVPVDSIHLSMRATDKETAIRELVISLAAAGRIGDSAEVLEAILERERSMSTGMQHGVAIPHGRSGGVSELAVAIGIIPEGIEFDSLDGKPVHIVFLVASPKDNPGPHLQVLAGIAGIANSEEARRAIMGAPSRADLLAYLVSRSS